MESDELFKLAAKQKGAHVEHVEPGIDDNTDFSHTEEHAVAQQPIDGMPNVPQTNVNSIYQLGLDAHTKHLIHPSVFTHLSNSKPIVSFVGRATALMMDKKNAPFSIRCNMEDPISLSNFFRIFPFEDNKAKYTARGNLYSMNNYLYVIFRLEKDQWVEKSKEKVEKKKKETKKEKEESEKIAKKTPKKKRGFM